MAREEHIAKIINDEFEKILKSINSLSQNDNEFSQQKLFFIKLYKNFELTKTNILIKIKNYFSNNKFQNNKITQINQFTKLLRTKKRNKSQNILNFQTNINFNTKNNNKSLFYSVIDGSSSDLKKNNSYLSPSSNKKKIKIKPIIIDMKNFRTYKAKDYNTNNNSNTISCANNLNTNNSNIIKNPYNINNIISSEEGEQDIKIIFSKKNNLLKNNFNFLLNKSHSELKLRMKEKKNNYSSNKICHQKKKISLVDDIINNIRIFDKDKKNKNKKNLKIFTGNTGGEGKGEKNISFSKNATQSFWKNNNNKKKLTINKINLKKYQFKTKTEIICKKKKMLNFTINRLANRNNNNNKNNINKINNNNASFKRNNEKISKIISNSVNQNNFSNNNNSLSNNNVDNDDSYNESIVDIAKEIIYFLDNLKNLQNSIIKKDSDIKQMKINFEMQKISLYQKAKKILEQKNNINNKNLNNESKLNISNTKGLNSTTIKSDSLSLLKNYFGNNLKNSISGVTIKNVNNNNFFGGTNDNNTKELNMSIINLKKTIEDMKINDEMMNEKLKKEIEILNNKLNEKIREGKIYEEIISENLDKIIDVHKNLIFYSNNKNRNTIFWNVPSDKKFDWYIHEINDIIEQSSKDWNEINNYIEINKKMNINQNIIKEELYKATIDIINWLEPYMDFENKDDTKKYILKLEEEFKNYGIKQALNSLKSKIKELIFIIENNTNHNINENRIDKKSFMHLNSVILNIQNNLMFTLEKKNNEILSVNKELKNAIKLNNKMLNILSNYDPRETRIFQEKYDYIQCLYNAEQDKVYLLQNEYMNMVEGLVDYIYNGNKILIELGKMWNIKPKNDNNFVLVEPDPSEMGPLNESDLLSTGSKKGKDGNIEIQKYKEEVEQYKKVYKYLENKMDKYDNLIDNVIKILGEIVKNMEMNQKQKKLFYTLFRMLNVKDEKILTIINSDNKK
mgnify:CR=1 FL=1